MFMLVPRSSKATACCRLDFQISLLLAEPHWLTQGTKDSRYLLPGEGKPSSQASRRPEHKLFFCSFLSYERIRLLSSPG